MANNKVQLSDGTVLLDLTGDTVTPENLLSGVTAHNAAGEPIVGAVVVGGGAGFSMTFPATAMNWEKVSQGQANIFLADGTTKSVIDYSTIGSKTIENVVGILIRSDYSYYVLRMTLSAGKIAQVNTNVGANSYVVTTAPNATETPYSAGRSLFWWPLADTIISSIEMYDTD